ncbi:CBS domain-containing protein [candidate division KSB1 bacterium]|nr:CBS domain-containing protein [candidate division KSB1 bacterium]
MKTDHLQASVTTIARRDFSIVHQDLTIRQALDAIRVQGLGEKIVYFYVVDDDGILRGVLPTRRLLTAELEQRLSDVMIKRVVTIQTLRHTLKLDLRITAGPVTLAVTDISTLLIYFGLATWLL